MPNPRTASIEAYLNSCPEDMNIEGNNPHIHEIKEAIHPSSEYHHHTEDQLIDIRHELADAIIAWRQNRE